MKHYLYIGLAAVVGAVGFCNVAQAATYDETTGYVRLLRSGGSANIFPLSTNQVFDSDNTSYIWSDHLAIHAGTNYYANMWFRGWARASQYAAVTYPIPCNRFVLDNANINWKCGYPSIIVFENEGLFVLKNSTILINADNAVLGGIGGTVTVQETSTSKMFTWQTSTGGYPTMGHGYWIEAKIVGDEDQYMRITTPADQSGRVYFMGDMSEYLGTINTISNILYAGSSLATKAVNATKCGEVLTCGADGAEIFIPKVTLDASSAIGCAATNTLVVDTLSLANGATVRGFVDETGTGGCVQVTNSFTAAGTIHVTVDMPLNGATNEVTRIAVLRVAKTAGTVTQDQVALGERSSLAGASPSRLPVMTGLEVVDDGDWTTVYVIWRQVVRHIVSNAGTANAYKFALAELWSNNKTPDENGGLDFYSNLGLYINTPGYGSTNFYTMSSFTFDRNIVTLNGSGAGAFSNLYVTAGTQIRTWTGKNTHPTLIAPITIVSNGTSRLSFLVGNSCSLHILGPISGESDIVVNIRKPDVIGNEVCTEFWPTYDNSDFTGSWIVQYATAAYVNPTQYMKFAVCDQKNLGRPLDSFTYDALKITNWQALMAGADDVVLDDATRGIWLQGNAQLITPSGRSLTLESPVTWAGTVHKSGSGTLVLASPSKPTYVGSSQTTTPVEGTNMLTVAEGGLKAATTNAVDGLALVFDAGAKLVLDLEPANEEMKDWGLYDVKWATPITLGEGATAIAVEFADAESTPPATVFTRAVATVPSDQAASVKEMLAMPRPWKSYDYSLTVRDNGDTTSTILVTYKPSGYTIILR